MREPHPWGIPIAVLILAGLAYLSINGYLSFITPAIFYAVINTILFIPFVIVAVICVVLLLSKENRAEIAQILSGKQPKIDTEEPKSPPDPKD